MAEEVKLDEQEFNLSPQMTLQEQEEQSDDKTWQALCQRAKEPNIGQLKSGQKYHVTSPYYRIAIVKKISSSGGSCLVDAYKTVNEPLMKTNRYGHRVPVDNWVKRQWQEVWTAKTYIRPHPLDGRVKTKESHVVVTQENRRGGQSGARAPLVDLSPEDSTRDDEMNMPVGSCPGYVKVVLMGPDDMELRVPLKVLQKQTKDAAKAVAKK